MGNAARPGKLTLGKVDTNVVGKSYNLPLTRSDSVSLLQRTLGLLRGTTSVTHDNPTIFLAIDLGYSVTTLQPEDIFEVGFAYLDTRNINWGCRRRKGFPIRTFDFCISNPVVPGKVEMSHPFVFGDSMNIRGPKKLRRLFKRIAWGSQHHSPLYHSNGAKIVLVGNNIAATLALMGRVVPRLWSQVLIEGIIDLNVLTRSLTFNYLLGDLDIRPESGGRYLSRAGNNASYTLRALLLYSRYTVEVPAKVIAQDVDCMLNLISFIALDGVPNGLETNKTVVWSDRGWVDENQSPARNSPLGRWRREGGSRSVEGQGDVSTQTIDHEEFVHKQKLWPPAVYDPEEGWAGIMYGKMEEMDQLEQIGQDNALSFDNQQDFDEGYLSNGPDHDERDDKAEPLVLPYERGWDDSTYRSEEIDLAGDQC